MKHLLVTDDKAGRIVRGLAKGDVFLPKDRSVSRLLRKMKWAVVAEDAATAVDAPTNEPPAAALTDWPGGSLGPVEPPIIAEADAPEEGEDDAMAKSDESNARSIDELRDEYEKLTGKHADARYGTARLSAEIGTYRRRDMRAEDGD